jgi:regulatory protein
VEQALDDLESRGYLSDSRFAEQYVAARKHKGFGPLRIWQELKQKGIAEDLIAQQMDPLDPDWRELLKHVAHRKFGATPPTDRKTQARWARYLEYRGFAVEQIRDLLWKRD